MPDDIHSIGHILDDALGGVHPESPLIHLDHEISDIVVEISDVMSAKKYKGKRWPREVFLDGSKTMALRSALHMYTELRRAVSAVHADAHADIIAERGSKIITQLRELLDEVSNDNYLTVLQIVEKLPERDHNPIAADIRQLINRIQELYVPVQTHIKDAVLPQADTDSLLVLIDEYVTTGTLSDNSKKLLEQALLEVNARVDAKRLESQ